MTPPPYVYRHTATFPRQFDEARPSWPLDLLDRILALPDALDVTLPDLTVAWKPGETSRVELRESRRRTIELLTSSSSKARADTARAAFLDLIRSVKRAPGDRVVVTREPIDVDVI